MSASVASSLPDQALPAWRDPIAWAKAADIVAVLIALIVTDLVRPGADGSR